MIAREGALARWSPADGAGNEKEALVEATHSGELKIGVDCIPCAVLKDGRRVISQRGVGRAFGKPNSGAEVILYGHQLPYFLASEKLVHFIPQKLAEAVVKPIKYVNREKGGVAHGVDAALLPAICRVWVDADDAGVLNEVQSGYAAQARGILYALATTGIIALVDEATGYQVDREKDALQKILEKYIAPELLPWTKRFPDEFYKQLFRLRGWNYSSMSVKRPGYVGKLTNQLVYEKLPPGVLDELREVNPVVTPSRRKFCHHQFLSEDVGNPHLQKQLQEVILLMRISDTWDQFEKHFKRAFPNVEEELSEPSIDVPGDVVKVS